MKLSLGIAGLSYFACVSPAFAQQLLRTVNGAAGDELGGAVIRAGDQNGDGYIDLLVGSPGFNAGRGRVDCISGAYLATGSGTITLWSVAPSGLAAGASFGHSLAAMGDLNNDGVADFAVGAPGGTPRVIAIDGALHVAAGTISDPAGATQFGFAIDACGDFNGDGVTDLAVGAPSTAGGGTVFVIVGQMLFTGGTLVNSQFDSIQIAPAQSNRFGSSISSHADFDGDGRFDFVVGAPLEDHSTLVDAGSVYVLSRFSTHLFVTGSYESTVAGEHLGESIDAAHDYDGDGVPDIVAGAPETPGINNTRPGRVVVLSGASVVATTPPYELYTIAGSAGVTVPASFHFGRSVRASGDLTGDGVGDLVIGSPDFATTLPFGPGKGAFTIYSGATGARIGGIFGANNEHLGDAALGRLQDLDGDGFPEFVVAGSSSDVPATDCGVLKCYRLFPCTPSSYCTAKVNGLGCTPAIAWNGNASASSSAPFTISCSNVINQKSGLLFYSHTPVATAFQGGFLCAGPSTRRTQLQSSGGSASGDDCTGIFNLDFNARIHSGIDPSLVAGAEAFCQYWSRDPLSASTTSLSNAVRLLINP